MSEAVDSKGLDLPPTQVVALGYSIVGAISDNAQITFHHAIAEDESDESVNKKLDRLMGVIGRQRALAEAPALRKELLDLQDMNDQVVEDMAISALNYTKAQADLDVQLATIQDERKKQTDLAAAQYKASGRGGSYEPRGATKANLERIDAGLQAVVDTKARNDAERDQFLANIDISTKRREARIEFLKARLAEIDKLVG